MLSIYRETVGCIQWPLLVAVKLHVHSRNDAVLLSYLTRLSSGDWHMRLGTSVGT